MHLRPASESDIPQIAQLWNEYRTLLCQANPRFEVVLPEYDTWLRQTVTKLNSPGYLVAASEVDDGLAGFIIASLMGDNAGFIESLVLDAHRYHGGLGRELVKMACAWLARQGVIRVFVLVPRHYAVEQAFWRALGGREVKVVDRDYWMETNWEIPPEFMWITL